MTSPPIVVQSIVDFNVPARTLIDDGCLTYRVISEKFTRKHRLPTFTIESRPIKGVTGDIEINKVAKVRLDIGQHSKDEAYFYVLPDQLGYDLILGLSWLKRHDARLEPKRGRIYLRMTGARLFAEEKKPLPTLDVAQVYAATMGAYLRRKRRIKEAKEIEVFTVSLQDIQKALAPKPRVDANEKLPSQYRDFLKIFCPDKADKLPPHRGEGIDHKIELVQQDGKEPGIL